MIRACRAKVSRDFPIILRFSQWKLQDFDAKLAHSPGELEMLLGPLADAGVDFFHASQRRYWVPEFEGSGLNLADWAKKLTGKPSMPVGSVGLTLDMTVSLTHGEPSRAADMNGVARMVADGEVDLVAVGRVLLSDPEWPHKIRRGDRDNIRPFTRAALATLN